MHLAHGCDIRPALTTLGPRSDGGPPVIEMWVRPKGAAPDVLFALLCGDVSAPVTFAVERAGWAPTAERFRDQESGAMVTVWFNAKTGERRYVEAGGDAQD